MPPYWTWRPCSQIPVQPLQHLLFINTLVQHQEQNIIHIILFNNSLPISHIKQLPMKSTNKTLIKRNLKRKNRLSLNICWKKPHSSPIYLNILIWNYILKPRILKNTILNPKKQINHENDEYLTRGIHRLSCPDCGKAYAGQTGSSFTKRFNVHHLSCKNNNTTAKFAQHLLEYSHAFGNMEITMQTLYFNKKGTHMDTWEKFYIYKINYRR